MASSYVLAVADGVSEWGERGIDSGVYSQGIIDHIYHDVTADDFVLFNDVADPKAVLVRAAAAMQRREVKGSCTVAVCSLQEDHTMRIAWVGDCGCVVFRRGRSIFETTPRMHDPQRPYQIGNESRTRAIDADTAQISLEPDDVVLVATDGILDNVFMTDLSKLIEADSTSLSGSMNELSRKIVEAAGQVVDGMGSGTSPFRERMLDRGYDWPQPGKRDDMAIAIGRVVPMLDAEVGNRVHDDVRAKHPEDLQDARTVRRPPKTNP